jgi:mono/diheme cytochrome c family protein
MNRGCWLLGLAGLIAGTGGLAQGPSSSAPSVQVSVTESPQPDPAAVKFFETKVRPILAEHCFQCHGPDKQKAGLRLDSRSAVLKGGESGPAVVPGIAERSLLIDAINYGDVVQMPPTGKLLPQAIADLTTWVKMGTPWPERRDEGGKMRDEGANSSLTHHPSSFNHWAFQPPAIPPLPPVKQTDWPQTPIDQFVLAQLEAKGLEPAAGADKPTLIRRATFDLTGLPPTPDELDAFLRDDSPDAYDKVVDRLLASPRYGERWGRHWLDVARYADSNGADENRIHANAWRYRDYVVAAFNNDQPYDRFIVEQLAGDLLPAADREARNRHLIATGFLAIGPKPLLANDAVKVELDVVDEQIDSIGRALLALTLGCARCHDHKFDPIPASDYYALAGIFKSTTTIDKYDFQNHRSWTERALGTAEEEERHQRLKAEYDRANERRRLSDDQNEQKQYIAQMKTLRKELAAIPVAMAVREGSVANMPILVRGNHLTPGPEVPRRFPQVLAGKHQAPLDNDASGRLELAEWLVRPDHPLTARVMVNRIWKWHFGEGIVRSVDNFGRLGEQPDNQPLLDYLAVRFASSGWSVKAMHRLMVMSATYQQSSAILDFGFSILDSKSAGPLIDNPKSKIQNPELVDPENRLLWRMYRRRLEAEEIRDALLSVSGQLDLTMSGAVLSPELNVERVAERGKGEGQEAIARAYRTTRRSLYLPVIRSGLYELFQAFDFAEPSIVTGHRDSTTVAPQALFLMNSDLVWQASQHLAGRLLTQHDGNDAQRVHVAYECAYGRTPTSNETARALAFIKAYEEELANDELDSHERRERAWQAWCRVILASNEFIYVE